jgi:rSAM/selenodomain-associated transferase 2/rSAM/selenodomain-associated transferase 1
MKATLLRHPKRCIIVFGRYPVPGRTKTRLIPLLGPVGAAELQRHLTETTLEMVSHSGLGRVWFCHAGGTPGQLRRWLGPRNLQFMPQVNGDLGMRMEAALGEAIRRGHQRVLLVGTDVPGMTSGHLRDAFDALAEHDVVLGPSRDGGYWLVGVRKPARIFDGISWGSDQVMDQTLDTARRRGLSTILLDPLNDIDTPVDLKAWQPDACWRRPYVSVVLPVLNEAVHIAATLERAVCSDAQVIVVDGGSRDKTVALARAAGVQVVEAPRGRAHQQNHGARLAQGRVVLFLHADTRLPANYVARMFETLLDRRVVLGAFGFKTDEDGLSMQLIERIVHLRATMFRLPYGDQGLFMRKESFDRQGGFPPVPIAEDLFLVRRMARLGRIELARAKVVTSGRRWRNEGTWRTTLINYLIAGGCLLGVDPKRLAALYRSRH